MPLSRNRLVITAAVALSVAVGVANVSGIGPAVVARLNAPLGDAVLAASLGGAAPAAGDAGQVQSPVTAPVPLEDARARWFALVYEGRNFDLEQSWEPTHP